MKNYEEKEKRLEGVLLRLGDLTNKFGGNQDFLSHINTEQWVSLFRKIFQSKKIFLVLKKFSTN